MERITSVTPSQQQESAKGHQESRHGGRNWRLQVAKGMLLTFAVLEVAQKLAPADGGMSGDDMDHDHGQ